MATSSAGVSFDKGVADGEGLPLAELCHVVARSATALLEAGIEPGTWSASLGIAGKPQRELSPVELQVDRDNTDGAPAFG